MIEKVIKFGICPRCIYCSSLDIEGNVVCSLLPNEKKVRIFCKDFKVRNGK